jgi:hypothetical protein
MSACKALLELVHQAACSDTAFRTASSFLCQVLAEVRDVGEMEVGTAECAMSVSIHDVSCCAKKLGEGLRFFVVLFGRGKFVSLVHFINLRIILAMLFRGPLWLWPVS